MAFYIAVFSSLFLFFPCQRFYVLISLSFPIFSLSLSALILPLMLTCILAPHYCTPCKEIACRIAIVVRIWEDNESGITWQGPARPERISALERASPELLSTSSPDWTLLDLLLCLTEETIRALLLQRARHLLLRENPRQFLPRQLFPHQHPTSPRVLLSPFRNLLRM